MENRAIHMQEEWQRLNKYNIPDGSFSVKRLVQDFSGMTIALENQTTEIEVFFDGIPLLVRNSVESTRMRTWGEVQLKYKDKSFFRNMFFYEILNSKLSEWLIEESCGFYAETQLRHYCIVTEDEMIDIIATFEPQIIVRL